MGYYPMRKLLKVMNKKFTVVKGERMGFSRQLQKAFEKGYKQGVLDFAERIKNYYSHLPGGTLPAAVEYHVEQIAKEMLEGVITDKNSQE